MEGGGIRDACPGAVGLLCTGWLSHFHTSHPAYEDGTDRVFRNVGIQQSDAGEIPKRIHTCQIQPKHFLKVRTKSSAGTKF